MSNYINQVSASLKNHISELANNPCLFLRNPNVDFSRKRKIDFKTFIGILMNSGGATMSKELLEFFDFNKNTPSVSAFTQQRWIDLVLGARFVFSVLQLLIFIFFGARKHHKIKKAAMISLPLLLL